MMARKLFIVVFFLLVITSCKESKSKLKECVDEINQRCPISYGIWGELSDLRYDDNNVIYTCVFNDDVFNIAALKEVNPNILKRNVMTTFKNSPVKGMEVLMKLIQSENAGIVYNYIGNPSGDVLTITLSSEEIASIDNEGEKNDYIASLQAIAEITNTQCPFGADEGILITRVTLDEEFLVYTALVDESFCPISIMNEMKPEVKQSILEELITSNDPSVLYCVSLCKLANVGIAYRYEGDASDDVCTIEIMPSEFKDVDINSYYQK